MSELIVFNGSSCENEIQRALSHDAITDVLVYESNPEQLTQFKTRPFATSPKLTVISSNEPDRIQADLSCFFYEDQSRFAKSIGAQIISTSHDSHSDESSSKNTFIKAFHDVLSQETASFEAKEEDSFQGLMNTLNNYPDYFESPHLNDLKGLYAGKTGIVVSTGPSLTRSLPLLKQHQHNAVLFSTGSALKTLLAEGITPDFAGVLERGISTSFAFENMPELPNTFLVAPPLIVPETLKIYRGPVLQFNRDIGYEQWIHPPRERIFTGSSVSHLGYATLRILGCDRILLVGQDLCFDPQTGSSHHGGAHSYQTDTGEWIRDRGENFHLKSFVTDGFEGRKQTTYQTWHMFRNHFRDIISRWGGEAINAISPDHGIPIPLTQRLDPEQAFAKYGVENLDKHTSESLQQRARHDFSQNEAAKQILYVKTNLNALTRFCLSTMREISEFVLNNAIGVPNRGYEKKYEDFFAVLEKKQSEILEFESGFFHDYVLPLIGSSHVWIGYQLADAFHNQKDPVKRRIRQMELTLSWYHLVQIWCSRSIELIDHLNKTKWKFW